MVEDAGYQVKIAISSSFAEYFINLLHDEMSELWNIMKDNFGIRTYRGLSNYNSRMEEIEKFSQKYSALYLYGAGIMGKECLQICRSLRIQPKGFIVTSIGNMDDKEIEGVSVMSIDDIELKKTTGIIISVGSQWQAEIIQELEKRKFYQYLLFE
ncbi:MAG: hypothetical protein NC321_00380 [Clostridium sp.]|nr:hypothetical protein [Clostridium sp.]